jgi:hypothetical protein
MLLMLRFDLNLLTLQDLPDYSTAPRAQGLELYRAIHAAGYGGLQGGDPALCREAGLHSTATGRVDRVGEAHDLALRTCDAGHELLTLHVGNGFESDAEMVALAEDIVRAADRTSFPLFIETHRATITQDMARTLKLVERVPGIQFNGDFSHWYTGLEMTYGNIEAKFERLEPVFQRVRFLHGRIGNSGSMQVDVGDGSAEGRPFVGHFRSMWFRSFRGFLGQAQPDGVIPFTPELLRPAINYARLFRMPDGTLREETDRWEQALVLCRIARECYDAARESLGR